MKFKCYRCYRLFNLSDLIRLSPGCISGPVTKDWISDCDPLPSVFCKKCAEIEIKEYRKMENLPYREPYRNNSPGSFFG